MQKNIKPRSLFLFYFFLSLLLLSINLIWISSNRLFLLALFLLFLYPVFISTLVRYFLGFLFPNLFIFRCFLIISNNLLGRKNSFFSVINGQINNNYFLLQKKPSNFFIFIDSKSAVVISSHNQKKSLFGGVHFISKKEEIIHSFKLDNSTFYLGPLENENPLDDKKTHEQLTTFHNRKTRANLTKAFTNDNYPIYSSFFIVHRLILDEGPSKKESQLNSFSDLLSDHGVLGATQGGIEKMITDQILDQWKLYIRSKTLNEILSESDHKSRYLNDLIPLSNHHPILSADAIKIIVMLDRIFEKSEQNNYSLQ